MQSNVFVRTQKLNPSPIKKPTWLYLEFTERKMSHQCVNHFCLLPSIESLPPASFLLSYASFHVSDMLNVKSQTTKMLNSEMYFVTVKTWLMIFWILMQLSLYSVLNSWASLKWNISVHFLTISKLECLFIRNVSVPYYCFKGEMCLTKKTCVSLK